MKHFFLESTKFQMFTLVMRFCRARTRPLKAASWTGDQSDSTSTFKNTDTTFFSSFVHFQTFNNNDQSDKYTPAVRVTSCCQLHSPLMRGLEKNTGAPLWHVVSCPVSACPEDIAVSLHSSKSSFILPLSRLMRRMWIGGWRLPSSRLKAHLNYVWFSSVFTVARPGAVMSFPVTQSICLAGRRLVQSISCVSARAACQAGL